LKKFKQGYLKKEGQKNSFHSYTESQKVLSLNLSLSLSLHVCATLFYIHKNSLNQL
jgi:hypothetical protein